jgi:hypothetical protein
MAITLVRVLSRTVLLSAAAAAIIGCGSDTEPSPPTTNGNSRFPMLTNYGGHLLSPLRIVAIAAANDSLRDSLFAFAKALPASQWWPAVATPFGVSPTATAFTVTGPPIPAGTVMSLPDIDAYVDSAAINSGYAADGRTIYVVFLPTGVSCSGSAYCGSSGAAFHVPFGPFNALAVIAPSPGGTTLQNMTIAASHEIIESATDPEENAWKLESASLPWEASPWGLDDVSQLPFAGAGAVFEENADMCVGTRYLDGGFFYQRVFSNQAAALGGDPCVPAIPTPYFNVTTNGWYPTSTGEVSIPITGWSVGTVADWVLTVGYGAQTSSLPQPTLSFSCPDTVSINGHKYCGIGNGKTATLHVGLPPAASGSFFTFRLYTGHLDANGLTPPDEDYSHRWIVGVYVP